MATTQENNEEESFIILGSSPGTSLDFKCGGANGDAFVDKEQLENAMKDLSVEANMALKAQFKLGDSPSPASMMVASTIVSEDSTTEELQKRFGELLDENVLLKETLKQNNDSMKEQFLLLASCQEDMMKTHTVHKEKFAETKELVEKLRQENKRLKQGIAKMSDSTMETSEMNGDTSMLTAKSGPPSSGIEFVTAPEDDTIDKLTAQLELVEKQRRQVIGDNDKLTWQKESLEHIVDAITKERDELKEKVKTLEEQLSSKDSDYVEKINKLNTKISELNDELTSSSSLNGLSSEEIKKRDTLIQQFESRVVYLQSELKNAQLRILDLENVKLEFSKHKCAASETVKMYKDQIQELQGRIVEAQTTVFHPVRMSLTSERDVSSTETTSLLYNVKLYDKTLKHLADLLNAYVNGVSESLGETLGIVTSLHEFKLDKGSVESVRDGLKELRQNLQRQHSLALNNIGQIKGSLSIFEGIFKDYHDLVKKSMNSEETKNVSAPNIEALTNALVARGQELQVLQAEVQKLRLEKEEQGVLRAQLEVYRNDFEAEREAREKMACDKENILTDLRTTQRRNQELTQQLQVLKTGQNSTQTGAPKRSQPSTGRTSISGSSNTTSKSAHTNSNLVRKKKKTSEETTEPDILGNRTPPPQRFDCPVCDKPFKTLILLQQHVDSCLL